MGGCRRVAWQQMESRPIAAFQVFYDSDCAFCTRSARLLRRLDRARRLQLTPLRRAAEMTDAPSQARLAETMHCRDRSGRWFTGSEAWLRMAEVVPALRPLGRVGRLPVARHVVEWGYRLIAANRHRLSRLVGDDGCAIEPAHGVRDNGGTRRRVPLVMGLVRRVGRCGTD